MCTVSWLLNASGYDVFFNRDEQKGRAIAFPPLHLSLNQTPCLMPIDPDGGGSWICSNHHGLSLCLLNYYQGETPALPLVSRGILLKSLAPLSSVHSVRNKLKNFEMICFAPFTLLVFDPHLNTHQKQVMAFQWDGSALTQRHRIEAMISSSVEHHKVLVERRQAYKACMKESNSVENAIVYHASHHPHAGQSSVCMHREDAQTVSFTHLSVRSENIQMMYMDGAPCQKNTMIISVLERKKQSLRLMN